MPITRVAKFEDLLAYMTESNVPFQVDNDAKVAVLPLNEPPLVGQILIRWEKELPYAQIIYPLVRGIPPERRAEVEHAICVANNTIPLSGFGYEYKNSLVYFRLTVPMYEEGMLAQSFRRQVEAVINNSRDFLVPFQQVVAGEPGEKILELAVAAAKARAPQRTT
jgi:hypothetical protein